MANNKDWIPKSLPKFRIFADNFCKEASTNQAAWGLVLTEVTALLLLQTTYDNYDNISCIASGRTPLDVQNTKEARVPYVAAIRLMARTSMKNNVKMTNENRTACGVVNNSDTQTDSPIASVSPEVATKNMGSLNLLLIFTDPPADMPDGQVGVITKFGFYAIGSTAPNESACTQIAITNKQREVITFQDTNLGMLFVGYSRYLNTRNKVGTAATTLFGVVS